MLKLTGEQSRLKRNCQSKNYCLDEVGHVYQHGPAGGHVFLSQNPDLPRLSSRYSGWPWRCRQGRHFVQREAPLPVPLLYPGDHLGEDEFLVHIAVDGHVGREQDEGHNGAIGSHSKEHNNFGRGLGSANISRSGRHKSGAPR